MRDRVAHRGAGRVPSPLAVAGVVLAAVIVAPMAYHHLTAVPDQRLVDLDVYRSAGRSVLIGRPVYEYLTPAPQFLPFTYPPIAALLAVPLALVPWPVLQWLWTFLIYAAAAVCVGYAFRPLLDRAGRWSPLVLGAAVGATAYIVPMTAQVRFGQVGIMLAALCVADCAARTPRWPRGALIGLATAIKLTPGVFFIYLWLTGRRRAAVTAVATAASVTLCTFLVLPAASWHYWLNTIASTGRFGSNAVTSNQSMRGWLLRLELPDVVTTVAWLVCVALVAYFGFRAARRVWLAGHEVAGVTITGLLSVLLSPVAWMHHLVWIVLVLGVLLDDGRGWRRWVAAVAVWAYFVVPVPSIGVGMVRIDWFPLLVGRVFQDGYGLAALVLVFVLARWCGRNGGDGPDVPLRGTVPTEPDIHSSPPRADQGAPR